MSTTHEPEAHAYRCCCNSERTDYRCVAERRTTAPLTPQQKADAIRDRRIQEQTAAWLTDDGTLLVRRYGSSMTVAQKVGGSWGPELALKAEPWDFGGAA